MWDIQRHLSCFSELEISHLAALRIVIFQTFRFRQSPVSTIRRQWIVGFAFVPLPWVLPQVA